MVTSRHRVLGGLVAGVVLIAGGGWAVGTRLRSPADEAALRQPPKPSLITSPVVRRKLTSTVAVSGTLAYGSPLPVALAGVVGGAAEAQRVTRAPRSGRIAEGSVLMEVNGRQVFALRGKVPMHRTMTPGATGADVRQLQTALRRLGFGAPSTGVFDSATTAAVQRWYAKRGYAAQEPDLTAKQTREQLRQAVQTAEETLLTDRKTLEAGSDVLPLKLKLDNAREDLRAAEDALEEEDSADLTPEATPSTPKPEAALPTAEPEDRAEVKPGDAVEGKVATVTSAAFAVTGSVESREAKLLRKGMKATMETADETPFPAVLSATGDAARPAEPGGEAEGAGAAGVSDEKPGSVPVLLTPTVTKGLRELIGMPVTVKISVGATENAVLTVPVAAVVTSADGRPRVQVELPGGGDRAGDVEVRTGLTADGTVEVTPVTPGALNEGDRVVVSGV